MAMTKIKGLQQWCRRMTDGYAHVDVANFTTAWRDGMAFCAIIHRFRPDLIDYDSLSPENVFDNCKLAFEVAEKELDIPAFLEADDMARLKVPDKLSVITYVSQYYNFLHALPQLGGPGVKGKTTTKSTSGGKRPPNIDTSQAPSSKKVATGDDGKENVSAGTEKTRQGTLGDKCNICQNRVYLLERHIEGGKLYHRSCYRHSELSPTNKVYTRSPFLSPSLSKETPPLSPSAYVKTSSSNSDQHQHRIPGSHQHNHTSVSGSPSSSKAAGEAAISKSSSHFSFSTIAASSDSPRKIDSARSKHSLAETDRGDAKKSKLQTTHANNESQSQKASAIRDRLKNLKEKYESPQKTSDSTSAGKKSDHKTPLSKEKVFPLSGKESRQLEKRREEILLSEKRAEKTALAGARNVPLIFQLKDSNQASVSTSASSILSIAKPSTSMSTGHSSTPATSYSSTKISIISNTPTSSKNIDSKNTDAPQRKTALKVVKAELVSKTESEAPANKDCVQDLTKQEKDHSKSNKKSAPDVKDSEKGDIASLQQKFLKSSEEGLSVSPHPVAKTRTHKLTEVSKHENDNIPTPILRKKEDNASSTTPKAAPRKSLAKSTVEINIPKERHEYPSHISANLLNVTPPNSARSTSSGSPPPLPSTAPPPLPTSPPPSLTSSAVINVNESLSKTKPESFYEEITMHGPVKSHVAVSSQAVASTSIKRFSSPAIHDPPLAVFVTPEAKPKEEKQVLGGLLASLAEVRSRSSSVPGISGLPITTSSKATPSASPATSLSSHIANHSPTPSSLIPEDILLKTGKPSVKSELTVTTTTKKHGFNTPEDGSKNPSAHTSQAIDSHKKDNLGPNQSLTPTAGKVPEALSVLNNLKKVKDSKLSESSHSVVKIGSGSNKMEVLSQNLQTNGSEKKAFSASREKLNHISTKSISSDAKKQESQDHKASENFKIAKLKQAIQSDGKPTSKATPTTAFDNKLKKEITKAEGEKNRPHKLSTSELKAHANDVIQLEDDTNKTPIKCKADEIEPSGVKVQSNSHKPSNIYEEDDLPDWKVALEERKKKLRENTAKKDPVTVAISTSKMDNEIKDCNKPNNVLTPLNNAKASPRSEKDQFNCKSKSPRAKSPSPVLSKPSDVIAAKTQVDKNLALSLEAKNKIKSGDWKRDAEMKIAALGGFDSEDEKKEGIQKTKRSLPKLPDVVSDTQKAIKTNVKAESKADSERKPRTDKKYSTENKNKVASEESVPEFLAGISRLKHVELPENNKQTIVNSKENKPALTPAVEKKEDDDFREKLQNLKHVHGGGEAIAESGSQGAISLQDTPKSSSTQKAPVQPKLTQPLPLVGDKMNSNNNKSKEEKRRKNVSMDNNKKLLMDSVNLSSSPDISDQEDLDKCAKGSPQRHSTPILENGKTSPKVKKKKISFFGKNKKEKLSSPAESPIVAKKKIQAPVNIDFDKSSEFESSLSDATARLTIEVKKTPPQRPPPPHANHKKTTSPKHISAIELQQQLLDIDSRLTDLELRGRDLEDSIRNVNVCEEEDDSLMIKWFELVSEKNDLVRQEADLVYMSREQDLETEQEHIELQLRYIMNKSDAEKSAAEKEEEEYLIQRKVELVEQRNKIVDSMDEDRLRYVEEDRDIEVTLRDKGLWKDSNGTFKAIRGKKVSNSTFYT